MYLPTFPRRMAAVRHVQTDKLSKLHGRAVVSTRGTSLQ